MNATTKPELLRIGEAVEREQVARLRRTRQDRDGARADAALRALRAAAEGGENLIPPMLEAVRAYASVGEMCQCLVPVFGTYREASVI